MTPYVNQLKRLSYILLASLSLNGILGCFLFYWVFRERPPVPVCENYLRPSESVPLALDGELSPTIQELKELSIEQLIVKLSDKHVIENGFTVGDLSLAALAGFYYFDVERALTRPNEFKSLEQKILGYGTKGETLIVYPALSDSDFLSIEAFIRRERWPFRAQGLFRLMKNGKFKQDPTLKEAFFFTPEYLAVERLLSRANEKIDKQEILALLLSGEWGKLAAFHETQRASLDLSEPVRRSFLLDWIQQNSLPAAEILLKTDPEFALKKLDDKTTTRLLSLLKDSPDIAISYASQLLKTPRSDAVRRAALVYLPEALVTKAPMLQPPLKNTPKVNHLSMPLTLPMNGKEQVYIVQVNDSLWKIAKRFQISIDIIRKMNGLTTDELKPGRPLRLPLKAKSST